ncbi:hypothetical protein EVAR_46391_1 [Eumeta japonica]|uniref:Uncharacterized protein n=1 Tax=Eumeta variegata TaxID=151549 RepID=A0A4C1WYF0_EUMVA|nr:hypothetical protein EVAR_46391_1 [Eumeta japonica]
MLIRNEELELVDTTVFPKVTLDHKLQWVLISDHKMKLSIYIAFTVVVCLVDCIPLSTDDEVIVTQEFFPDELAIYTAEHEIVSLVAPVNAINFDDDDDDQDEETESDQNAILFFALADIGPNGEKIDKGLYILQNKVATKLLDNGRDTSAELGDSKVVYFGASDGIYKYNYAEKKAEKYGTITDSVLQLAKVNGSDAIYILTDDKQLYKVTEAGTKKTRIDGVTDPKEIVIDYSNNLFCIGANNKPYVVTADEVREITGFSSDSTYAKLIRPPFLFEDGLPFVSGDKVYMIYSNETSETTDFTLQVKPSAYAMEAALIQYYGYNKKIYEYNILAIIMGSMLDEMKSYLQNFASDINKIATRSRSDLRANLESLPSPVDGARAGRRLARSRTSRRWATIIAPASVCPPLLTGFLALLNDI